METWVKTLVRPRSSLWFELSNFTSRKLSLRILKLAQVEFELHISIAFLSPRLMSLLRKLLQPTRPPSHLTQAQSLPPFHLALVVISLCVCDGR
jgi:hypothetical protein